MTAVAALMAIVAGPRGPIHFAATDRGLVALDLMTPTDEFVAVLERRLGSTPVWPAAEPPASPASNHLAAARAAIGRFFDGDPRAFEDLPIDLRDRPAWDRAVLRAVAALRRGQTASYGDIAREIGRPGAARAVGGAVGRNPISLVIPCHRVIAGDGTLGGYGGGWWGSREERLGLKRDLLAREGIEVPERGSDGSPAR